MVDNHEKENAQKSSGSIKRSLDGIGKITEIKQNPAVTGGSGPQPPTPQPDGGEGDSLRQIAGTDDE